MEEAWDQKTLEACLKSINQIGGTVHRNICTGRDTWVSWGMTNWIESFLLGLLLILVFYHTVMIGATVIQAIRVKK